jgi:hypothetical protein
MAKFTPASEEYQDLVNSVASEMGLKQDGIEFQAFNVKKSKKEVVKIKRASEIEEILGGTEDTIIVILFEEAFDRVDSTMRREWIRMALEPISYDSEKCKINIGCPMVTVPVGYYEKFKDIAINAALLQQYTLAQIEDERKEEEARRKALKTKKGGKN